MRSYLIVANRTLASPTLAAAVAERVAGGDAAFHVVVPATPGPGPRPGTRTRRRPRPLSGFRKSSPASRRWGSRRRARSAARIPSTRCRTRCASARRTRSSCPRCPSGCRGRSGRTSQSKLRRSVEDMPVIVVTAPDEPAAIAADTWCRSASGNTGSRTRGRVGGSGTARPPGARPSEAPPTESPRPREWRTGRWAPARTKIRGLGDAGGGRLGLRALLLPTDELGEDPVQEERDDRSTIQL